jgi:hypothetical protein
LHGLGIASNCRALQQQYGSLFVRNASNAS